MSNVSSSGYLPDSCRHSWEILAGASQHRSLITTAALLLCLMLPPRASLPRTEIMCLFLLFPVALCLKHSCLVNKCFHLLKQN